jgi:glyoxylase-like metal-dependent hydrolase (beta-lactamase superfamily II)
VAVTASLVPLAAGVYVWLHETLGHRATNSGVVIAEDGLTVIDAGVVPTSTSTLALALSSLSPLPTRRLVLSGSHIDLVGGSASFPLAGVYGSMQTSTHLDQPPNPDAWSRLYPEHTSEFADLLTRPVTHIVSEPAHLCAASIAIPAPGQQFENLAVQVPGANVVFAGGLACFSTVPLGFEADFPAWIETLETMATWGELFVPSHGPVGGHEELRDLRNYLEACMQATGSTSRMPDGPWTTWQDQHFTPINVERAAMLATGDPSPPPSMLALLGIG